MSQCPTCHKEIKDAPFCSNCGTKAPDRTSPENKVNIRSPEARANAQVSQSFYMPGSEPTTPPSYYKCPQCGRRKKEHEIFDCMGECGRQHLCLRHEDEEYEVCNRCANALRQSDKKQTARWTKLETELATHQQRVEEAKTRLAALEKDNRALEKELNRARAALSKAEQRLQTQEKELAQWKKRAQSAEAELAEIRQKQQEQETARKRAADKRKQQPKWQQIGIDMIKIPAGDFLYGDDNEKMYLGDYHLAKTPVTNTQYNAFADATGHTKPSHWQGGDIPKGKENHPVVKVSWKDAQAFCHWTGLRLPTEQEWEKGARGTDGRAYPWGDQDPYDASLCNFDSIIDATTPVDRYSGGASPYGLLDMAGNVWEWCKDWCDSDKDYRVLRGGSWGASRTGVRSAARYDLTPDGRVNSIGFPLRPLVVLLKCWVLVF